jgi:hypothetical protein
VKDVEKQTRVENGGGEREFVFGGLHVCCLERQVFAHSSGSRNGTEWKQKKKRRGEQEVDRRK